MSRNFGLFSRGSLKLIISEIYLGKICEHLPKKGLNVEKRIESDKGGHIFLCAGKDKPLKLLFGSTLIKENLIAFNMKYLIFYQPFHMICFKINYHHLTQFGSRVGRSGSYI